MDPYRAPLLFNQSARDSESQAGAFSDSASGFANLPELLEDDFLVFRFDTYAAVAHGYLYECTLHARVQVDRALFGSKFHRVAQEVVQDLLQPNAVSNHRDPIGDVALQGNALAHGKGPNGREHFRQQILQQKIVQVDIQLSRFDLGEVEDVIDQLQQMARSLVNVSDEALLLFVQWTCISFGK